MQWLTSNRLIFQHGVKGCGTKTAYGLARYGLGDTLLDAARNENQMNLEKFLVGWRKTLCARLREDPDGYLGHKYPSIAREITDSFPDLKVLRAYTHPVTSWSLASIRGGGVKIPSINLQQADLSGLASFCMRRLEWSPKQIHSSFKSLIWEGFCIRMLIRVSYKLCR